MKMKKVNQLPNPVVKEIIVSSIANPSWRFTRKTTKLQALRNEIFNFGAMTVAASLGIEKLPANLLPKEYSFSYSEGCDALASWIFKNCNI